MTYISATQVSKMIRKSLKSELGLTSKSVSVRSKTFSMGESVSVSIKVPGVSFKAVKAITSTHSRVRHCKVSGDILGGGNLYVHCDIDRSAYSARAAIILPIVTAIKHGSWTNFGTYQIQAKDTGRFEVYDSADGGGHFQGWSADGVADRLAVQLIELDDKAFAALPVVTREETLVADEDALDEYDACLDEYLHGGDCDEEDEDEIVEPVTVVASPSLAVLEAQVAVAKAELALTQAKLALALANS